MRKLSTIPKKSCAQNGCYVLGDLKNPFYKIFFELTENENKLLNHLCQCNAYNDLNRFFLTMQKQRKNVCV